MPTGSLKVMVTGPDTAALGALASWAMANRPCMDASAYSGIQFTLSGTVTNLRLQLGTPATLPAEDGGICTNIPACSYAHYQKDPTPNLAAGGTVKVDFKTLVPAFGTPAPFDKSALVSVVFITSDAVTTHSFTVDNISFYLIGSRAAKAPSR